MADLDGKTRKVERWGPPSRAAAQRALQDELRSRHRGRERPSVGPSVVDSGAVLIDLDPLVSTLR